MTLGSVTVKSYVFCRFRPFSPGRVGGGEGGREGKKGKGGVREGGGVLEREGVAKEEGERLREGGRGKRRERY